MKRIAIIGGGVTGLAAAHRILERKEEWREAVAVTLLEAGPRVGGIVHTEMRDGFLLERGPDSFISEKPEALELSRRLGLESHLIETNTNHRQSFIVRRGRLLPVPEGFHLMAPGRLWPFLTSGIFSWSGKARIAMDLVLPRRDVNAREDTAEESLAEFVRRRLGREALERMAQPMVGGIYTADPEKLSLQATMPRFLEMESKHGSLIRALRKQESGPTYRNERALSSRRAAKSETSGARYNLFLSFDRGMQLLTDRLAERISASGKSADAQSSQPSVLVNTVVQSLERKTSATGETPKWIVKTNSTETIVADAICLALPAYGSAKLLHAIDEVLASELDGIPYASSATINLAYQRGDIPHALDGFGFVVPFIEKRTVMACTFSSVKFAGRAPEGFVLLRAFVGGALQPEMLTLEGDELVSRVGADLRDLLGVERRPLFTEVARWERSMPQYHIGQIARVQRIETRLASLSGLTLAGNAYSGTGIPDCIRSGEAAADAMIDAVVSAKSHPVKDGGPGSMKVSEL